MGWGFLAFSQHGDFSDYFLGWPAYLSLWSTVAFNMSNFQVGASLLALGINWKQVFGASLVGHFLAATLVVFSSYPGLYYNISFPVATRVAWGRPSPCRR